VLSPSTVAIDRRKKRLAYLQIPSLEQYLIVDPAGTVESSTPDGGHRVAGPGEQLALACANTLLVVDELFA